MTATATVQTAWNCRWSRPGHRITGLSDAAQPENVWVCARGGERRSVSDDECARCSGWEAFGMTIAPAVVFPRSHSILVEAPPLAVTTPITRSELAPVALRTVLVLIAVFFVAVGVAILTRPLAIPFTVALWLCAAGSLGAAAFGRLSPER